MLVGLRGSTGGQGRDTKSPAQSAWVRISPDPTQAVTSATAGQWPPHSLPTWWADQRVCLGLLPAGWNPSSLPTSTASFSCSCGHSAWAQGDARLLEGSPFRSPSHTSLPSVGRTLTSVQTGTSQLWPTGCSVKYETSTQTCTHSKCHSWELCSHITHGPSPKAHSL